MELISTHTKFLQLVSHPFAYVSMSRIVFFVLLSAVDVPAGIQQVSGSTPTAVPMLLNCLCLSLSFKSPHKVLLCDSVSAAKDDTFCSLPLYTWATDDWYKAPFIITSPLPTLSSSAWFCHDVQNGPSHLYCLAMSLSGTRLAELGRACE